MRALRDGNTECDRPDRASRRNIAFSSNQRIAQSDESSETAIGRGSDDILIIRIARGDWLATQVPYGRRHVRVIRFGLRLIRDEQLEDDLIGEVLLRCLASGRQVRKPIGCLHLASGDYAFRPVGRCGAVWMSIAAENTVKAGLFYARKKTDRTEGSRRGAGLAMTALNEKMVEDEFADVQLLLPWHAAGTLNARDARRVEEALARDPELARQYAVIREEYAETIALNESLGAPSLRAIQKLFAAIDTEPERRRRLARGAASRISGFFADLSPRTLAWLASLAALLVVILAVVIGLG